MPPVIKFSWIANTSQPNETKNWKPNSLGRSVFYTLWANKLTSSSYQGSEKCMMFSTCHCWSRTPPGRGGWMKKRWNWTTVIMKSTKWRLFATARSMRESQQAIYRGSTIWYLGKGIRKKKIPGSLHQPFSTLGSSSAHSIRIILRSRQQLLRPSIPHHQWPGQQSNQNQLLSLPNKSEANQLTTPINELKKAELS